MSSGSLSAATALLRDLRGFSPDPCILLIPRPVFPPPPQQEEQNDQQHRQDWNRERPPGVLDKRNLAPRCYNGNRPRHRHGGGRSRPVHSPCPSRESVVLATCVDFRWEYGKLRGASRIEPAASGRLADSGFDGQEVLSLPFGCDGLGCVHGHDRARGRRIGISRPCGEDVTGSRGTQDWARDREARRGPLVVPAIGGAAGGQDMLALDIEE